MKYLTLTILLCIGFTTQAQFDNYFENKSLRMDYYHSGNDKEEVFSFDGLLEEPYWGGSKTNLVDEMGYGNYFVKVFDLESNTLIYSRGFNSLFGEWQTTNEAKETWRSLSESVVIPYPKSSVKIVLYSRSWEGVFEEKFAYVADPENYFIKQDQRMKYPSFDVHISGDPAQKVDVVILPEGYTADEMGLFVSDCRQFAKDLFTFSPFSNNTDKFNIRGILAPSEESGVDIPAQDIWKRTLMNASFYTFDSERYLMSFDNMSVRDLAANAAYDQIYILVNSTKYGGGAILNYYNVSVNSNEQSAKIIVHEFGHGFAGLADEYFDSSTSYNDFYNLDIEPYEPNISTMVAFEDKWQHMIKKRTPVPTPDTSIYYDRVGAFEGGGYVAKGMFRPMHDCLMHTFKGDQFCPVCEEAIQKMIDFYTE